MYAIEGQKPKKLGIASTCLHKLPYKGLCRGLPWHSLDIEWMQCRRALSNLLLVSQKGMDPT